MDKSREKQKTIQIRNMWVRLISILVKTKVKWISAPKICTEQSSKIDLNRQQNKWQLYFIIVIVLISRKVPLSALPCWLFPLLIKWTRFAVFTHNSQEAFWISVPQKTWQMKGVVSSHHSLFCMTLLSSFPFLMTKSVKIMKYISLLEWTALL